MWRRLGRFVEPERRCEIFERGAIEALAREPAEIAERWRGTDERSKALAFGFQRALYGVVAPAGVAAPVLPTVSVGWLAGVLAAVVVASLLLLRFTWGRFFDRSGDFAEDL